MKSFDLWNAIGGVDDDLLQDAKKPKKRSAARRLRKLVIPAVAVLLLAAIVSLAILSQGWEPLDDGPFVVSEEPETTVPRGQGSYVFPSFNSEYGTYPAALLQKVRLVEPTYPTMASFPVGKSESSPEYVEWKKERTEMTAAYTALGVDIDGFGESLVQELLTGNGGKNAICSPVNVYLALSMLAEVSGGETREQILDALGAESIESLREQVTALWQATYRDDGTVKAVLGNSLWLRNNITFNEETLNRLSEIYYASAYHGNMTSAEFRQAFLAWLNYHTGGLLEESADNLPMTADTAVILASTLMFQASWEDEFNEKSNRSGTFYGLTTDTSCTFMNGSEHGTFYEGSGFTATSKAFSAGGNMTFILPNEGLTPEEILQNENLMTFMFGNVTERRTVVNSKSALVSLKLPKFDVSSDMDLLSAMENMGITDVSDADLADFSPLMGDHEAALTTAQHAVRVRVDEEGCIAAAYTVLALNDSAAPLEIIDFTIDRPFIFVIYSDVGLPLFVGVVNDLA